MQEFQIDDKAFEARVAAIAAELDEAVTAEIVSRGPAAAYAAVVERGSRKGEKPWPEARKKTVERGPCIAVKAQPEGFIRRNAERFAAFLRDALKKRMGKTKRIPTRTDLVEAANEAGEKALALAKASVPRDSGQLHDSLKLKEAK